MARLRKKEWIGVLLGLGGTAVVALITASELPAWSIFVLTAVAGISFSGSAYLLGWFRAPVPTIGPPVKTALVLLLIWVPLAFLLKHELPGASFPFVKPAVVLNPNGPGTSWLFIVVNRGHSELYNVDMSFQDMVRTRQVTEQLKAGSVSPVAAAALMQSEMMHLHYDEMDRNTVGGNDNECAKFYWEPPLMTDEQYDIVTTYRKGTVREQLRIKQVGTQWQYAMRVTDEGTHEVLIECRDPQFPIDGEWKQQLPKCFPTY